jgi:hypothetical protein
MLIGQILVLQSFDSNEMPTQSAPPFSAAGLLQRRLLVWLPPPQVLLQVDQADQSPQLPFTLEKIKLGREDGKNKGHINKHLKAKIHYYWKSKIN